MLKDKRLAVKKMILRFMLSLVIGVFAGAVPGTAMMSYGAENAVVQAAVPEAVETSEGDGSFILYFFGGLLLLILLVVAVVVAVTISTAGVVGAQEDE